MAEIIGHTIIKLASVDSTNNYAIAHLSKNTWEEGTVVVSGEQINGRGQINNLWESEPDQNILMSIVLYPDFLPVHLQFLISKIIALGVCETLLPMVDGVLIKWPNDIYVGHRKIAGILIENAIMGNTLYSTVAGIGLNVNQKVFKSDAPNPVSLIQLTGIKTGIDQLVDELLKNIDHWFLKLKQGCFEEIDQAYLLHLYRRGDLAAYNDKTGTFRGILKGVNEIGQLLIQPEKGALRCYHFKEVEFMR